VDARLGVGVVARLRNIHRLLADVARDGREVCVATSAGHSNRRPISFDACIIRVLMVHWDAAILLRH